MLHVHHCSLCRPCTPGICCGTWHTHSHRPGFRSSVAALAACAALPADPSERPPPAAEGAGARMDTHAHAHAPSVPETQMRPLMIYLPLKFTGKVASQAPQPEATMQALCRSGDTPGMKKSWRCSGPPPWEAPPRAVQLARAESRCALLAPPPRCCWRCWRAPTAPPTAPQTAS